MELQNAHSKNGWADTLMLVIVAALAAGCVEHRQVYVHREPAPIIVEPPPPEPVPIPAPTPPPRVVLVVPEPAPPPAPIYLLRLGEELERMLAPIALYPDPLLAQLLPATTLPSQVVLADRYVREGGDLNQVDLQAWDRSIKALTRYPEVLTMLDDNLAWTTQVGLAFLNQPGDVMDAIQRLRARAYALGNLQSCPEQVVYVENRVITIVPAAPARIYVPVYVPEVVYAQRPSMPGRLYVSFGLGRPIGAWLNHDCDWQEHRLIVWDRDRPRPTDWWTRRPSEHRAEEVRNVTVWRARPSTDVAQAGSSDRGWGAPARPSAPVSVQTQPTPPPPAQPTQVRPDERSAPTHPVPEPVRPGRQLAPVEPPPQVVRPDAHPARVDSTRISTPPSVRPIPAPKDPNAAPVGSGPPAVPVTERSRPIATPPATRPLPAPKEPNPVSVRGAQPMPRENKPTSTSTEVRPAPATKAPQPAPTPVATRPAPAPRPQPVSPPVREQPLPVTKPASAGSSQARPNDGALAGIESARDTRASSSRGQQSREAIAKPLPAARAATPPGQAKGSTAAEPKRNPNSRPD